MAFQLPALPYASDALAPSIDKETMEIHHGKHHQAYVDNLNKALEDGSGAGKTIEEICKNISAYSTAVRNNGGGHYNHSLFWTVLAPAGGKGPEGELSDAIQKTFGSLEELKKQLQTAGATRFGSGWAWLIVNKEGNLQVTSTPNQDNPLMDVAEVQGTPIFGIDVWEHAYYLNYQNKRPAYLEAIFNVVNWEEVARRYQEAK